MRPGLPAFAVVGLGDAAVRESRERVQAAIRNSGFQFPGQRLTANLAPAHLPKVGPGSTSRSPAACLRPAASSRATDCRTSPCSGSCPSAAPYVLRGHVGRRRGGSARRPARRRGRRAPGRRGSARHRPRRGRRRRPQAGGARPQGAEPAPAPQRRRWRTPEPPARDLADVRGQDSAVRASVVAVAGAHNLCSSGPPGVGKTMLAWRLPGLLPALSEDEAIEVSRIDSLVSSGPLAHMGRERPFRAPHHSVTAAGLIGGANPRMPGEAVRAHHGVLFLDELSEFSRTAWRRCVSHWRTVASPSSVRPIPRCCRRASCRGGHQPVPCGLGGDDPRCACTDADLARHRRRLSGALLEHRCDGRLRRPWPQDLAAGARRPPRPRRPGPRYWRRASARRSGSAPAPGSTRG